MRLFLSAGTVRRVRIVLLRATHLPFVALIWAYESKWRHLKRTTIQLPPMSARGQGTSEPTESRCRDPHHPSVVETNRLGPGKAPSVDQQAVRELEMGQVGQVPQLADLIDTIERLRTQVEAIAQQK